MPVNAALLRTVIVATGAGIVAATLGSACLDFAGEDWGACATTASSGATTPSTSADASVDCGTPLRFPDASVLGSGSATPP